MIDSIIARDENGKKLPSAKISKNTFRISNAMNLSKINYWVNDSRTIKGYVKNMAHGRTNIEDSLNFVVNASGWFGFFDGLRSPPLRCILYHPRGDEFISALPLIESEGQK